jgi:5'-nucleotidase
MEAGPFRGFLEGLARIQSAFPLGASPIRTALVTARDAPAHYRVVNTLRAWNVDVDETYFLGDVEKTEILAAFGAHIFFDDQFKHISRAATRIPSAHVLWPDDEVAAPVGREPLAEVPGRSPSPSTSKSPRRRPSPSRPSRAVSMAPHHLNEVDVVAPADSSDESPVRASTEIIARP